MKRTVDEQASRFDEQAEEYDDGADSPVYRACLDRVIDSAAPTDDDVVLDVGTGTGAVALALAGAAKRVVGRDVSEGMLERARQKAADAEVGNVEFGTGSFREPDCAAADVVVSNFAMHHIDDDAKRTAIAALAETGARRFVLGDIMLFEFQAEPGPFYDPAVDDPATVGTLLEAFTDAGYAVTAADRAHPQAGVLVAERVGPSA